MDPREFWNRLLYWVPPTVERELAALPDVADRNRARTHAWRVMLRRPRTWVAGLAAIGGCVLLVELLPRAARAGPLWLSQALELRLITAVVVATPAGFALAWWLRHGLVRATREFLISRGLIVCLQCGYSLAGAASDRCPECGAADTA